MKVEFNRVEKKILFFISLAAGVVLAVWVVFQKGGPSFISPFLGKILGEKQASIKMGEGILGTAQEVVSSDNLGKVLDKSSEIIESSPLSQPVQVIKEVVIEKVNQTIETVKELPDQEIKKIKKEICKQWLEEEE